MSTTENPQGRTPEDLEALIRRLQKENDRLKSEKNRVGISFRRVPESGAQIKALYDERFPYFEHVPEHSYTLADRHIDEEEEGKELSQPTDGNTTLIEAENLAALSALQLTHQGKVDVIYIDPPYNTGNKDFVYNDARTSTIEDAVDEDGNPLTREDYEKTLDGNVRSVGKDNPERHSLWLSFMEKRLWLAKQLLSDAGVIFVSIDDNEQARLKLLMDEVFGEENFVSNLKWHCRTSMQYSERLVSSQNEYVLVYAKVKTNPSLFFNKVMPENVTGYSNPDNDPRGDWLSSGLIRDDGRKKYTVTTPSGKQYNEAWLYTEDNMNRLMAEKRLWFGKNADSKPRRKSYLKDFAGNPASDMIPKEIGTTEKGNRELKNVLGNGQFNYPKSVSLIKYIISLFPNPNAIVLDFFAGSGTTAHAVAELNKEDGGNRQCILVTHGDENGKNIAEDVTAQRMKRVLSGKNWADGKDHESLPGELNYYRLQFAEKVLSNYHAADVMRDKFLGYVALEQDVVLSKDQLDEEGFYMLSSSRKNVAVVSDDFLLMDGSLDELMSEAYVEGKENLIYLPLADDTDINEYVPEGWTPIGFPVSYMDSYKSLISLMKSNKTLLQPVSESE